METGTAEKYGNDWIIEFGFLAGYTDNGLHTLEHLLITPSFRQTLLLFLCSFYFYNLFNVQ